MKQDKELLRHHRLFWLGMLFVVVLIGGRIAWIHHASHIWNNFADRETDFMLLGKPYQPNWEETSGLEGGMVSSSHAGTTTTCESLPPFKNKITQELASDRFGSSRSGNRPGWVVTASVESFAQPEHFIRVEHACETHSSRDFQVWVKSRYRESKRILRLDISEGYKHQGREVILYFKLTENGFVHVEDAEGE